MRTPPLALNRGRRSCRATNSHEACPTPRATVSKPSRPLKSQPRSTSPTASPRSSDRTHQARVTPLSLSLSPLSIDRETTCIVFVYASCACVSACLVERERERERDAPFSTGKKRVGSASCSAFPRHATRRDRAPTTSARLFVHPHTLQRFQKCSQKVFKRRESSSSWGAAFAGHDPVFRASEAAKGSGRRRELRRSRGTTRGDHKGGGGPARGSRG